MMIERNEIDSIIDTILSYKRLIIGITTLSVVVSLIYAFAILKPIYKADILLKVAQNNTFVIEDEATLVQLLINRLGIERSGDSRVTHITQVIKPKYSKGVIRVFAEGDSKAEIETLLRHTADSLREEHNRTVEMYIQEQRQVISNVLENIGQMEREREELISQNRAMQSQLDSSQNGAYAIAILRNDNKVMTLDQNILKQKNFLVALNKTLQPNRTFNTKIEGSVHFISKPITTSKKLILAVGFVTSLLLSILLALLLEFLKTRREI